MTVSSPKDKDAKHFLMGNEAIARGAMEGGVAYATGYPGNPSSEIIESLQAFKNTHNIEVEWSANEIVALEAAAAFSFSGLRAMVTMKQNGMNVCSDFLNSVVYTELRGALLIVVCDDPGAVSSSNEQDSRHFAKMAQVPLLEPSTPQEAKEMTKWLLDLSHQKKIPCLLRSVSRLSHSRGGVTFDTIPLNRRKPTFDKSKPIVSNPFLVPQNHRLLLQKNKEIQEIFQTSPFNRYIGPEDASFVIISTGQGSAHAIEAVNTLDLNHKVGIIKLGTTWPLPDNYLINHLKHAKEVLFVEEIDPFTEDQVKALYAENCTDIGKVTFYGKNASDIKGKHGPGVGEINTDIILESLISILNLKDIKPDKKKAETEISDDLLIPRDLSFCSGCPHRASFYAINTALELDDRDGFVLGDIGCYSLGSGPAGFNQIKVLHCMGSGMGNATGFSKLTSFGFKQPTVSVVGDSTFYHAGIPALINAVENRATAIFIVLDNSVTAMTGFQINAGSPFDKAANLKSSIKMEDIATSIGVKAIVLDPIENIDRSVEILYNCLQEEGVRMVVFRRVCTTFETSRLKEQSKHKVKIDSTKCISDDCGCNRFCTRILSCPSLLYDNNNNKAVIQESTCQGCNLCVQLCPYGAITNKEFIESKESI